MIQNHFPLDRPAFCPNPECPQHTPDSDTTWYSFFGYYTSKAWGKTRRFRCKSCGKTSSSQTFSATYWTHRPIDLADLDYRVNSCEGYRQIGRALTTSYPVIKNRFLRLCRNYLNLFDAALAGFSLPEDIAFDGFESYVRSQYIPDNFNIAVGTISQIPYAFSLALLRRKGTMTARQRQNREILDAHWRPPPHDLVHSCKTVFRDILSLYMNRKILSPFTIYTDQKNEYSIALNELPEYAHLHDMGLVTHRTISSHVARNRRNPLFPVNYLDREIRKNSAAHARETVRADREVSMTMSRMVITLGHHAFRKPYRISNRVRGDKEETHADKVRLLDDSETKYAFEGLFIRRNVWTRQRIQAQWMGDIWLQRKKNPPVVDFRRKTVANKGQPGNGWVAAHLVA